MWQQAIYLINSGKRYLVCACNDFKIIFQFIKRFYVPDYIDFWFDTIHCHGTVNLGVNESLNKQIDPPIILVLTGKDKYEKVIILIIYLQIFTRFVKLARLFSFNSLFDIFRLSIKPDICL